MLFRSGKSTLAITLAKRLLQAGIQVGGLICPGIFTQGRKTGIKSFFPETGYEDIIGEEIQGKEGVLAGIPVPKSSGPDTFSYGRWEFRLSALAEADTKIVRDIDTAQFVFVDEIGPLELDHGLGMSRTLARLDTDKTGNSCILLVCVRQDLAPTLAKRWPKSKLVELVQDNPTSIAQAEQVILDTVECMVSMVSATGNAQT